MSMFEGRVLRKVYFAFGVFMIILGMYKLAAYASAFFMLVPSLLMTILASVGVILVLYALSLLNRVHYKKLILVLVIVF